jgi:apolipoprotein N-acyltransferase
MLRFISALCLGIISGLAFRTELPLLLVLLCLVGMFSLTYTALWRRWILLWSVSGFLQYVFGLMWLDVVGFDVVVIVALFCTLPTFSAALLSANITERNYRTSIFVLTLVVFENIRDSFPFGGFGWLQYGIVLVESPIASIYKVTPQLLATLLVLVFTAVVALSLHGVFTRKFLGTIAIGLSLITALSSINFVSTNTATTTTVTAVQGGVERYGLGVLGARTEVLQNHVDVTKQNLQVVQQSDVVLWPENSLDIDPKLDSRAHELLTEVDALVNPPILLGAVLSPTVSTRSNTTLEVDGGVQEIYTKQRRVPFGEFLPMRDFVSSISDRAALLPYDFVAGKHPGLWKRDSFTLTLGICFEVADSVIPHQNIAQSDLIVIQTNNATYQFSQQSEQQLLYAKLRSIESQRPLVSISTSGISAVIDDGVLVDTLDKGDVGVLTFQVNDKRGITIASRIAPFAGWIVFFLWVLGLVYVTRRLQR